MIEYVIKPHQGVGPVRFGMTRAEVRACMPEAPEPFLKIPTDAYEVDGFHGRAFQVHYAGEEPRVEYVELGSGSGLRALIDGSDVFSVLAEEIVDRVSRFNAVEVDDQEMPYVYVFNELDLSFWRPTAPESEYDEDGRYFMAVGIGVRGYYSS